MLTGNTLALAVRRVLLASAAAAASLAYPTTSSVAAESRPEVVETVIVTGSIIRRTDMETPRRSPF